MSLLVLPPERFRRHFGNAPFLLEHRLAGEALFALPRLVDLARRLPAAQVEYNAGDVPVGLDPARTPHNGLSVEETLHRIEHCRSWMVLKNVEHDADYARLLERCLAEVRAAPSRLSAGMRDPHAFIFVSSPGAVTPYHIDPEENFLLQIRGTKTMSVFDRADAAAVSEQALERFFDGGHRNLDYREQSQALARAFHLVPGLALHVPFAAPHWVRNGPAVSVSFSITFNTRSSMRRIHAHRLNSRLRRWGIDPVPVGRSAARDAVKQLASRAWSRLQAFVEQAFVRARIRRA